MDGLLNFNLPARKFELGPQIVEPVVSLRKVTSVPISLRVVAIRCTTEIYLEFFNVEKLSFNKATSGFCIPVVHGTFFR